MSKATPAVPLSTVMTAADARKQLPSIVARFREEGVDAEPIFYGSHRKPEAVILSMQRYEAIMSALEDQFLQSLIKERLSRPHRWITQAELMEELGITEEDIRNSKVWVE